MEEEQLKPKKKRKVWLIVLILILIGFFSIFLFKTSFTISQIIEWTNPLQILPFAEEEMPKLPEKDPERINILLLGMRGLNEPGEGQLLSDAMVIISLKKNTGQVAMISLPRDLYTQLWCSKEKKKLNFAYAHGGLDCAKKTISYISGLYLEYAINVNFEAFEEIVDTLGGVTVYLDQPFEENFQWSKEGWEQDEHWFIKEIDGEERWGFYMATGTNYLDGQTALYYVRSRYSTNDFDRMRRQQKVLMAIKEKALSLGVLTNPIKIYNLLDVLGKNIRTDMGLADISNLLSLADQVDIKNIRTKVFDTSPQGLLYQTFINEEYVLLPVGDNFDQIQQTCLNIFD
ncbi:MAG: LCP family protein [Patescibacteria group bacterium]